MDIQQSSTLKFGGKKEDQIQQKDQIKIRGWLLFPAFFIVLQPILLIYKYMETINKMPAGGHLVIITPVVIADILILIGLALTAYLFFTKKKMAPGMFVALTLYIYLVWSITDAFSNIFYSPILANLFICFVFIPYFVYSKRVQLTFVYPLEPTHVLDKLYAPLESVVIVFFSFLKKHGRWLFPVIVIYLITITLLYAFLRAVFVLNNVGEMWGLLL